MNGDVRDKIQGCLIGGAVGDALGYQVEFETGLGPEEVTRFSGSGPGVFSDDTQMTLFTAAGLLWQAAHPDEMTRTEAVYQGYLDWLGTQQRNVSPHVRVAERLAGLPGLNVVRDPGMTCLEALGSGRAGTVRAPLNDSKGAGGIMRVAPVGLFGFSEEETGRLGAETSALTHGHPLAVLSAFTLALIIRYLVLESPSDLGGAVRRAAAKMRDFAAKEGLAEQAEELAAALTEAVRLSKEQMSDQAAIMLLGAGWVAEEALSIAIYSALKHAGDFEKIVVSAVNHDGDSDTTGAIAGNIAGAALGLSKIPDFYRGKLELSDEILALSNEVVKASQRGQ